METTGSDQQNEERLSRRLHRISVSIGRSVSAALVAAIFALLLLAGNVALRMYSPRRVYLVLREVGFALMTLSLAVLGTVLAVVAVTALVKFLGQKAYKVRLSIKRHSRVWVAALLLSSTAIIGAAFAYRYYLRQQRAARFQAVMQLEREFDRVDPPPGFQLDQSAARDVGAEGQEMEDAVESMRDSVQRAFRLAGANPPPDAEVISWGRHVYVPISQSDEGPVRRELRGLGLKAVAVSAQGYRFLRLSKLPD